MTSTPWSTRALITISAPDNNSVSELLSRSISYSLTPTAEPLARHHMTGKPPDRPSWPPAVAAPYPFKGRGSTQTAEFLERFWRIHYLKIAPPPRIGSLSCPELDLSTR